MKKFLSTLGNKINFLYNNVLNKIAIKSIVYKELYNKHSDLIIANKYLPDIFQTIDHTQIGLLVQRLYSLVGSVGNLSSFDVQIVRITDPNDIILVRNDFEKFQVQEEMKYFTGSGQVFTLEDLKRDDLLIKVPVGKIYVFSSVWLKDLVDIENLSYKIKQEKEKMRI